MTNPASHSRRRVLAAGAALAAVALAPETVWATVRAVAQSASGAHRAAERALLDAVCETVIPATDTPGASEVRVPEFVLLAVRHRLSGAVPGLIARLDVELARRAGRSFLTLRARQRHAVLEELDAEAYSPLGIARALEAPAQAGLAGGRELADWRALKALIVLGYYTSEPGATRELRYEFVPGRYDADVPYVPGTRALMNDWYGNLF